MCKGQGGASGLVEAGACQGLQNVELIQEA